MMQNKEVQFVDLKLIEYKQAWDLQETLLNRIATVKLANRGLDDASKGGTNNYLLFCEHPHVYTLGKSGDESHLLLQESFLENIGATYFKTNRGGDITYHGPGQLVGYPILDLENFYTDIHLYLRMLEEAIIKTCEGFGLIAGRIEGLTGVWIDPASDKARKICALGVKASRWISMHGFALNVNPDLTAFAQIVPCGITDADVTSLEIELGRSITIDEVAPLVERHVFESLKKVSV
jgi:lipoyl(octanoyl) transferase